MKSLPNPCKIQQLADHFPISRLQVIKVVRLCNVGTIMSGSVTNLLYFVHGFRGTAPKCDRPVVTDMEYESIKCKKFPILLDLVVSSTALIDFDNQGLHKPPA